MNIPIENAIYEQGFCIIDNFLEQQDYQMLRAQAALMYNQGQFKSAKIGHQLGAVENLTIRNDQICWLDENTADKSIQAYFAKINNIAQTLNRSLFLGLADFEAHFAIYLPGTFYKKHIDQFATTQARRLSCVYYLNETWHASFAGQLKLYDCQDQLITSVLPQGNRFICFNSNLPHEVCETKQTRYSLTGWMKTRSTSGYAYI